MKEDYLEIGGVKISCRLFVGTGKFSSHQLMRDALLAAGADVTTVALRRVTVERSQKIFWITFRPVVM